MQPVLTSLKFEDFAAADHLMKPLDIVYAGVKLDYSLKRPPKKIAMKWGFYAQPHEEDGQFPPSMDDPNVVGAPHDPRNIDADFIIHGDPDDYDIAYFSPDEPEFIWHRPAPKSESDELDAITTVRTPDNRLLRAGLFGMGGGLMLLGLLTLSRKNVTNRQVYASWLMVGAVACVVSGLLQKSVAAPLSDQEAIETFGALHANIYSAFDHNTEDEIYDALAQSVDGSLLDRVYKRCLREPDPPRRRRRHGPRQRSRNALH